jgi:hypothetical protein
MTKDDAIIADPGLHVNSTFMSTCLGPPRLPCKDLEPRVIVPRSLVTFGPETQFG